MLKRHIYKFIEDELNKLTSSEVSVISGFKITNFNDHFIIESKSKVHHLKLVQDHIDIFSHLDFKVPIMEAIKGSFTTSNVELIIKIAYFDLFIFLVGKYEYSDKYSHLFPSLKFIKFQPKFTRSTLFEPNKLSIVFDKNTENLSYLDIVNLGFDLVEFPKSFSFQTVEKIAYSMRDKLLEYDVTRFNVNLRIKKLGLYRKKGMYSPEFNTIFLDPRHTYVWQHELGHYYHTLKGITDIDFEEFANNF